MRVLIAGGGTGGHLYPGIALAEEITTRQKGNEVLFVGTAKGIEARVVPDLGYPLELVEVSGLKRTGFATRLRGLLRLPGALFQSFRIVRRFEPDVAVGVGGYASGPVILAAWLMRVPCAVLEQNSVPGVTNRILGRIVQAVFVMFTGARAYFPKRRVHALGNPIRRSLMENFLRSRSEEHGRFRILVLGGSQGAHTLNLRMMEAMGFLRDLSDQLTIIHQTGGEDAELVRRTYAELGVDAEVYPFIQDISWAYRRADLLVCRAGATTLAELMVAKKAAILVPYPYAADNHQEVNARAMVDAGAAVMLVERELDGGRLAQEIKTLFDSPGRLADMEQAARKAGRPEAAREIVDAFVQLTRGERL